MITDEQLIATTEELVKAKNVLTNIKNWNFATCGPYKLQEYEAKELAVVRDLIGAFILNPDETKGE